MGMTNRLAKRIQIFGWGLFIISAIGFLASSVKSRDIFGIVGGVFFLIACFVFLIPLVGENKSE
jgi:hypothetical protein